MTEVVWGVIALLAIGLSGTLWWIFVILKLAQTEDNVHLQNKKDKKDS